MDNFTLIEHGNLPSRRNQYYRSLIADWGRCRWKKGIPLAELKDELHYTEPDEDPEMPSLDRGMPFNEKMAAARDYIEQRWGNEWDWNKFGGSLPIDFFLQALSTDDMVRWCWRRCTSSKLGDEFECNPRFQVFQRLEVSLFKFGSYPANQDYNHLVRAYRGLKRFKFRPEDPDFEVFLDHPTHWNATAYANYTGWHEDIRLNEIGVPGKSARAYIDGALGFMVHYRGQHVLTIGFSPQNDGVLLQQVQLARRKGNRFLFRLQHETGMHLLDYVIQQMTKAFCEGAVWLADGASLAKKIASNYPEPDPEKPEKEALLDRPTADTLAYIAAQYDRTLYAHRRLRKKISRGGVEFRQVVARKSWGRISHRNVAQAA